MNNYRKSGYLWLPLMLALGLIGGIFIGSYITNVHRSEAEKKLSSLLGLISTDYVDQVDLDSVLERVFPYLLSELDPHSVYIPKTDLQEVVDDLESSFSGVGIQFQLMRDSLTVIEVVTGGPAEKVGLRAGDRMVEIDGEKFVGPQISPEAAKARLRGPKGSSVKVKVKRRGERKLLDFEIVRGDVPTASVDSYYMVDDSTGFVKVSKFARDTYSEFLNAAAQLREQGARKYIIDLRGNLGGYMEPAIRMANEFLTKGQLMVYSKGRRRDNETLAVADGTGSFQSEEVVVLMNEMSASASEIFAGAIQDNDRGLVIGRRSFGKGLVQDRTIFPDSSAVQLTVARYYTPSGRCIQKEYKPGDVDSYQYDIADRYSHGEFYSADSIRLDKSKAFRTTTGRTVFGGGGIMPDIFVPNDTTGYTTYLAAVANRGLLNDYAFELAQMYGSMTKNATTPEQVLKVLPRDDTLLDNFVSYAVRRGVPARWYYITQSRDIILHNLKALVVRDILGYNAFYQVLNQQDSTVARALKALREGKSPVLITPDIDPGEGATARLAEKAAANKQKTN